MITRTVQKSYLKTCTYHRLSHGIRIWVSTSCGAWFDPEVILRTLNLPDDALIKKGTSRRSRVTKVFRSDHDGRPMLFKTFDFVKYKDRYCHAKYLRRYPSALSEFCNSHRARLLGISVPQNYAYFEMRSWTGVKKCGVVLEFIENSCDFSVKYKSKDEQLRNVTSVLVLLYKKGVNHIDISPHNILVDRQTQKKTVIDWQYCSFHEPCNENQLILHATKYLGYMEIDHKDVLWKKWLTELHRQSSLQMAPDVFLRKVKSLEGKKLRLEFRLNLDPDGLGIEQGGL